MEPKYVREQPEPRTTRAPRKRFRVEKLEERIAPARGGNATNKCSGSLGSSATDGTGGSGSTFF